MIRNNEDFVNAVELKWPNKFDFSKTKYNGARNNVILICKEHGEFEVNPHYGLKQNIYVQNVMNNIMILHINLN